ncbi:MAG: RsmD family RNA methyltransferase [Chitinophagales bacterium]|nr:RsmD family RNA methyltransferase [Chitinophagales bacterium]
MEPTRPTTDFAKEALFNILQNNWDFDTISFLDLFAGTGGHSYEFASRGCKQITTVDNDSQCVSFIKKTAEQFGFKQIQVLKMDVFKFIEGFTEQYDIIFAGPPYPLKNLDTIPDLIFEHEKLKPEGWLILEHHITKDFDHHPHFFHKRKYGTTVFSMFK